ncbi:glycine betaine/L-proline ABC transporter substrate-binding protein ProX [Poseidonibacter lekithochrous]|uniref:glycine betaine/L-proline ABC transporter substrate-binding protein ProX n=1 Tax=Poseidonibacter TaxID=2321187 RepID=UPI001C091096|nr:MULTISPECIES: glycine betaine/L-proline ABC transporter substrate-binding protein ProX [Poseidonibacter]MBU3013259.1 glycine betaine/L-proline ABC transporter substrate-binding protein ProX [Poseidonibacter lekithochrous]MDO6826556.1 glycine betaine/L-proline ABC transporter substrate-binding protein ProX [Poseidonibacter sp. 1_MG-2023]
MLNKKSILSIVASLALTTSVFGAKVTALTSGIAEEMFQTLVVNELLKKMGHEIEGVKDVNYDIAYQTIASNADSEDVYFLASVWDPLHKEKIAALGGDKKILISSNFISNCAQGYLIDKKTADKYNIKYYNDLKKPEIAKLFDLNGNGKADLTGCNAGWGCEKVIEHQLDAYGMRDSVEHIQGEYSALIANTLANYKTGKPILYYTWTPYWVSGKLVPGKDVTFLQVTHSANPSTTSTKLANGADYGFNINNQKIATNMSVKTKHKDIAKLFDIVEIDVNDISGQNMLMTNGQNKQKDIKRHVQKWLETNKTKVDSWIKAANAAK